MTIHKDDGFTLAETLIALWVVSLAMGCVLAGFALLSRFEQAAHGQARARRAVDASLSALTQAAAVGEALSVSAFAGDARHLRYACAIGANEDNPRLCTLNWPSAQRVAYVSDGLVYKAWPVGATQAVPQPLGALILQDAAGTTLGVVRIQAEQSRDCQFDTVSRTCREEPK